VSKEERVKAAAAKKAAREVEHAKMFEPPVSALRQPGTRWRIELNDLRA